MPQIDVLPTKLYSPFTKCFSYFLLWFMFNNYNYYLYFFPGTFFSSKKLIFEYFIFKSYEQKFGYKSVYTINGVNIEYVLKDLPIYISIRLNNKKSYKEEDHLYLGSSILFKKRISNNKFYKKFIVRNSFTSENLILLLQSRLYISIGARFLLKKHLDLVFRKYKKRTKYIKGIIDFCGYTKALRFMTRKKFFTVRIQFFMRRFLFFLNFFSAFLQNKIWLKNSTLLQLNFIGQSLIYLYLYRLLFFFCRNIIKNKLINFLCIRLFFLPLLFVNLNFKSKKVNVFFPMQKNISSMKYSLICIKDNKIVSLMICFRDFFLLYFLYLLSSLFLTLYSSIKLQRNYRNLKGFGSKLYRRRKVRYNKVL